MKVRCEKKDLQTAVLNVSHAVSSSSPNLALTGILFESTEEGLRITGYDTRIGIFTTIDAEIQEDGKMIIPARFLSDLVRKLPDGMVLIDCDESFHTNIRCGKTEVNVIGINPEDYPQLMQVNEDKKIAIPEKLLKSMISQTIFAVSTSETRPVYTGVLFEVEEEMLTLVAVDGYRMAKRSEQMEDANMTPCTFIIPGNSLSDVEKICGSDEERPVVISLDDKYASFFIDRTVLITRRLEGEFMNYKKSIPSSFRYELTVEREEFYSIVERVSLVIKEKENSPITMIAEDGILDLSCITSFGHAADSCICEGNGEGLRIGFNHRYMLDAMKAASGDVVKISMNTSISPIIIQAVEEENYLYMVLPVRLHTGEN